MSDFDEKARDWDSDPLKVERARAAAAAIRRRVRLDRKMTALEYGCGTGLLSFALRPYLGPIVLADNSPGMLEVLGEKIAASGLSNMTPLRLDLATDPFPPQRYQLIYMLMVLHHIPDTDLILRQLFNMLERPGTLCIADLDAEDGSFHSTAFDGHHGFDQAELRSLLQEIGFSRVRSSIFFKNPRNGRDYPLFLAVAEKK
jgi:ubiquinone/menaquinone biosynthesis C-methylase UbiE